MHVRVFVCTCVCMHVCMDEWMVGRTCVCMSTCILRMYGCVCNLGLCMRSQPHRIF
jgi:hypothetical protein